MEKKIRRKHSPSNIAIGAVLYLLLAVSALLCVLPMWHVLMGSFSDTLKFGTYEGFLLFPIGGEFKADSYRYLFTHEYLWRSIGNAVFYTAASVALGLVISIMAAYALTRKNVLFRRPLMLIIVITMFFNGGLIPFYMVVNQLGLVDTPWSLIIPSCCNAINIIMLNNGFLGIPDAIFEAAELDGAGAFRTLFYIAAPLCVPFIVVIMLFNGVAQWNSWANASMFISTARQDLYPLQLVLRDLLMSSISDMGLDIPSGSGSAEVYAPGIRMACVIIASLPLLITYPFLQKYFEKGMIIGSVKG